VLQLAALSLEKKETATLADKGFHPGSFTSNPAEARNQNILD